MRTYLQALASGDTVQACAQFTASGKRKKERDIWELVPEVDGLPCEQALPVFRSVYGNRIRDPKIKQLEVGASRATGVGPGAEAFVVVKRGDTWKLQVYG